MCGIFGAFGAHENLSMETLKKATETLYHRGPDCMQYWISEDSHVGLGHARLSINHQKYPTFSTISMNLKLAIAN